MPYFDNANSTQVDERVIEAMLPYFREYYGTSGLEMSHAQDVAAVRGMEDARKIIAGSLKADPRTIIFTSGATESNNLAIRGVAKVNRESSKHIITTSIEVQSVLKSCQRLEGEGYEISYLEVDKNGLIDLDEFQKAIRKSTVLVSIHHGNGEVGVVQPIEKIAEITSANGIIFHIDATQTYLKIPINTVQIPVDLVTIDGHLVHGPKGVGALYIRRKTQIERLHEGGDEERRLRPGVESIPAIVGFAKAVEIWEPKHSEYLKQLADHLRNGLSEKIPEIEFTGHPTQRIPGLVSLLVKQIEGEAMLVHLDMNGFSVSTGSACSSKTLQGSHVLKGLNYPPEVSHGSLRVSFSRYNNTKEIDEFIDILSTTVERLREFSPLKSGEYFAPSTTDENEHHHNLPCDEW